MSGPRRLRAYALTGGRTHASAALSMEAMVVATGDAPDGALGPEARAIMHLCHVPQSLVDLSSRLDTPIGVVRVLLGDLIGSGLVTANSTPPDRTLPPHQDLELLGELLDGIEAL